LFMRCGTSGVLSLGLCFAASLFFSCHNPFHPVEDSAREGGEFLGPQRGARPRKRGFLSRPPPFFFVSLGSCTIGPWLSTLNQLCLDLPDPTKTLFDDPHVFLVFCGLFSWTGSCLNFCPHFPPLNVASLDASNERPRFPPLPLRPDSLLDAPLFLLFRNRIVFPFSDPGRGFSRAVSPSFLFAFGSIICPLSSRIRLLPLFCLS